MGKINKQLLGRSMLVLVLVIASCFMVAAAFASGQPGTSSSSSSSSSSTSSGGGTGSGGTAGAMYSVDDAQFTAGYSKAIGVGNKFRFTVGGEYHFTELTGLTANTATISVTSDPQSATLSVGDVRRFELTGDNYYDLAVTLNSITVVNETATKADIKIQSNSDEVILEEPEEGGEEPEGAPITGAVTGGELGEGASKWWLWVLIAVVVVAIVGFIAFKRRQ